MDNKLYLSITHYDDPKQTIIRKVHTSFLGASSPISLSCEVNYPYPKRFGLPLNSLPD